MLILLGRINYILYIWILSKEILHIDNIYIVMNLRSIIKNILKEEKKVSPYFRRRLDWEVVEDRFNDAIHTADQIVKKTYSRRLNTFTFRMFKAMVMSVFINDILHEFFSDSYDMGDSLYDELHNSFSNLFDYRMEDYFLNNYRK
jgi:hypothetical protein